MDDVRTTISDSISLPALPRVHLASTPPQKSSSSKEVDIKKHHSGLILQNESSYVYLQSNKNVVPHE